MEQNLKTCPYCGEEIMATAQKCKHCGEWLEEELLKESTDVAEIETEEDEENYITSKNSEPTEMSFFKYYFFSVWSATTDNDEEFNEQDATSSIPGFNFNASIARGRFWGFLIICSLTWGMLNTFFINAFLLGAAFRGWVGKISAILFVCFYIVKMVEVQITRLNNIHKNKWLVLLNLIPFANIALYCMYFFKGDSDNIKVRWKGIDFVYLITLLILFFVFVVLNALFL